jgi:hypothetical protein
MECLFIEIALIRRVVCGNRDALPIRRVVCGNRDALPIRRVADRIAGISNTLIYVDNSL